MGKIETWLIIITSTLLLGVIACMVCMFQMSSVINDLRSTVKTLQSDLKSPVKILQKESTETTQKNIQTLPVSDNIDLNSISDKIFLTENANYALYALGSKLNYELDEKKHYQAVVNEVIVLDKNTKMTYKLTGGLETAGMAVLVDDYNGYLLLSSGTGPQRAGNIISLYDKKVLDSGFGINGTGNYIFWKGFLITLDPEYFEELPYLGYDGSDEHYNVIGVNLEKDSIGTILKASAMQNFVINKIQGDKLYYTRQYVNKLSEWAVNYGYKQENLTFDLNTLDQ